MVAVMYTINIAVNIPTTQVLIGTLSTIILLTLIPYILFSIKQSQETPKHV
jgi:FtsH-binding integral membrane protein